MWFGFMKNRAMIKGDLIQRIVVEGLTLERYLVEDGEGRRKYEKANAKVYQMVGEPLLKYPKSMAYSLLAGETVGDGLAVLENFVVYFDGRTEEELEDLEDNWRDVSFQSAGVVSLATYLAKHKGFVSKLNASGGNVSRTKAFRRVLKQLPQQYALCRQGMSQALDSLAAKEAAAPRDPANIRSVQNSIRELTRRLVRFSYDERIEEEFTVKGLLQMSLQEGERINYARDLKGGPIDSNTCKLCGGKGHWAGFCPSSSDSTGKGKGKGGTDRSTGKGKGKGGSNQSVRKDVVCWECGGKGHISRFCPNKKEGANQTTEEGKTDESSKSTDDKEYDDFFGLNMIRVLDFELELEDLQVSRSPTLAQLYALGQTDVLAPEGRESLDDFYDADDADDEEKADEQLVTPVRRFRVDENVFEDNVVGESVTSSLTELEDDEVDESVVTSLTREQLDRLIECESEIDFLEFLYTAAVEQRRELVEARMVFLRGSPGIWSHSGDDVATATDGSESLMMLGGTFADAGFAIVDSGATTSSEPFAGSFVRMDTGVDLKVSTAGGEVKAGGLGNVNWNMKDASGKVVQFNVSRVLHLQKAERLLSVWQCVQQGHSVVFGPDKSFIHLVGGRRIPFEVRGKYWVVRLQDEAPNSKEYCLWNRALAAPISTALAHRRLGHASEWQMKILKDLGLMRGMNWSGMFPHNCRICLEYTCTKASEAKSRAEKSDEPGSLVAYDFWMPPAKQTALFSVKAVLGLRDEATGMPFCYPISSKADLVKILDVWYRVEVAPYEHIRLQACCCDNEAVNLTDVVREWFGSKGVKFVPSPPYMKGKTNIIEAFWRPLLSKVRAMLGDQDVAVFYFPAAVVKATKLIQMLPSKANTGCSSPYALWYRKIPYGGHLRVWGSRCVSKDFSSKSKLEKQGQAGRFLGDDESSAWKVMLDKSRKLVKSAHVKFDERSAKQRALDTQVGSMAEVRDGESDESYDSTVLDRLQQAPRGKLPAVGVKLEESSVVHEQPLSVQEDEQDRFLTNPPVELRRSSRVRQAPDQFRAEPGTRSSQVDRTRAEQHALQSSADVVNLNATSLAEYYTPCEGLSMVHADSGLGVHVCGDPGCNSSAGMFFLQCDFPGERMECVDGDLALFNMDQVRESNKQAKSQHGQGSEVVIGQEAERVVDFVPKNNKQAEQSPAWCASAWRQIRKFENHKSARVVKDEGQPAVDTIWVRRNKTDANGNVTDNYSRLAIRGDMEVAGIHYDVDDISTYVADDASVKILVGAMAVNGWAAFEGDADGAFHQGTPSRRTFAKLPWLPNVRPVKGFVWEILKCVYGKVEAAARFNDEVVKAQAHVKQTVTRSDSAVYVRKSEDGKRLLGVCTTHIDDMVQYDTSGAMKQAEAVMRGIGEKIVLKESSLRPLQFMLGRSVHYLKDGAIAIMRRAKIDEMVKEHEIDGSSKQPAKTSTDFHTVVAETEQQKRESQQKKLRELVGSQQYIATDRKDIAFVVNNLSRYVAPQLRQQKHWYQAKQLGSYLKRTRSWAQVFGRNVSAEDKNKLIMFVDSEWCGINGTRFTYGCFVIIWNGGVVAMKSFVIKLVCSSTCEAEYVALSEGCKRLRQLSMFCEELCFPQGQNKVFCDNEAAIRIAKDNGPSRGKHIDIRYHFVKDHYRWKFIDLRGVKSQDNPADMGTKCQPVELFTQHCGLLGIMDIGNELKQLGFDSKK